MIRTSFLVVVAGLMLAGTASAQTPAFRFRWQPGQVLSYRVEQTITAAETLSGAKSESKTKVNLLKRWQVQDVDAAGVATLHMSLAALRMETTTPGGDTLLFDSANPDKSSPQLKEQMARYVGQTLAILRMDGQGRVLAVTKSEFGPASRFEASLPFQLALPTTAPKAGEYWERSYKITVEPPQGTGEKYDAVQRYTCKTVAGGTATIALATTVKVTPENLLDRVPLLQDQPEGEVVFDLQAGLVRSARLQVNKELKNHQGEGSSYTFQSSYVEEYVGNK